MSRGSLARLAGISTFVYGMIAALAGTIVPQLSRKLGLTPEQIGNVFLAQALGMVLASVSAGPLVDNRGKKTGFLLALTMIGGALFLLPNASNYGAILACMVLLGLGGGTMSTASNTMVSDAYPERRATIFTLLKVFYGVGGFVSPFLGANLFSGNTITLAYVIAALAVATLILATATAVPPPSGERRFRLAHAGELLGRPPLYLFSVLMFLYVACEVGVFNWLARHLIAQGVSERAALNILSLGFALGLLLGRVAFAGILLKVSAANVTLVAACAMAVTTFLMVRTVHPTTAGIVAFLVGVAMAPVFPGVLAMVGDAFPKMTGTALGFVITCGWAGLAVSSRLIGAIAGSDPRGIQTGLLVLPIFSVLMIVVNLLLRASRRRPMPAAAAAAIEELA